MKKNIIIILPIILLTIIITLLIQNLLFKQELFLPTFYQLSEKQNSISEKTSIETNNLKISLKGLYLDGISNDKISSLNLDESTTNNILKFSNNNIYNLLVDFSSTDGSITNDILFDYLVYDNSGNIIMTSLVYNKEFPKTNQFIKYFTEKEYNSNNVHEFENYKLSSATSNYLVDNDENSHLMLISSASNTSNVQKTLDLSKLYILIINPSYRSNNSSDRINLDNTIFEFILEN